MAGITLSIEKVGLTTGITLTQALSSLSDDIRKPIVLILDEAQHAITSEAGVTNVKQALRALKDKALVWKATRGLYALEDNSLAGLIREDGMIA